MRPKVRPGKTCEEVVKKAMTEMELIWQMALDGQTSLDGDRH